MMDPPAAAWKSLLDELVVDAEENEDVYEDERPEELVEQWRREYVHEVTRFRDRISEIARKGGSVMTWENDEGWL